MHRLGDVGRVGCRASDVAFPSMALASVVASSCSLKSASELYWDCIGPLIIRYLSRYPFRVPTLPLIGCCLALMA